MYEHELTEQELELTSIYLDPNNPRFPDRKTTVSERRFTDPSVQARAESRIEAFGISDLANSILQNGFLPLDRIVVREIAENPGKFVVVEGNRRLAALRKVAAQIDNDEVEAEGLTEEQIEDRGKQIAKIKCLVYSGTDMDIAWILQGVRHLSGIRDWSPAQKAELIAKEINERGLRYKAVGESLGMNSKQVGRYYRVHSALQQMRKDPEYGERYEGALFTLFDEAFRKTAIKEWLDWDEDNNKFKNVTNLQRFYSWITKDPDFRDERRIHDPRQMKILAKLVDGDHSDLLDQIEAGEVTLEQAEARAEGGATGGDWGIYVDEAENALRKISAYLIAEAPDELAARLESVQNRIGKLIESAKQAGASE